ncbi:MAG: hypothetical protein R3B09_31465 [Nannocystaceae bacterium]
MVALRRLRDALRDGDPIWAVIRGSALAQDGRSAGLTAPSGQAQEAVIRAALAAARVDPEAVAHVEAHGSGTPSATRSSSRRSARSTAPGAAPAWSPR